jgi:hypothetical protein
MKPKIKSLIILTIVFILGTAAGYILACYHYFKFVVAPFNNVAVTEIAIDAQQLKLGQAEQVLKRKVSALPACTEAYYKFYFKFVPQKYRYSGLWNVQRYYEISGDKIPDKIKPILDALPKRPLTSCELKSLKDANSLIEKNNKKKQ